MGSKVLCCSAATNKNSVTTNNGDFMSLKNFSRMKDGKLRVVPKLKHVKESLNVNDDEYEYPTLATRLIARPHA